MTRSKGPAGPLLTITEVDCFVATVREGPAVVWYLCTVCQGSKPVLKGNDAVEYFHFKPQAKVHMNRHHPFLTENLLDNEESETERREHKPELDEGSINMTYFIPTDALNLADTKEKSDDMTPSKDDLDNYDILDLESNEDTDDDDDERPQKAVPAWAQGTLFRDALQCQATHPPDVDEIFFVMEATPELNEIFSVKHRRFNRRTSSGNWEDAPVTHNG